MTRFTSLIAKSLVTLMISSGTLATNLQAQSDSIILSVPFPFTVGTQNIAPGTYQFSLLTNRFLLSVVNVKTGNTDVFCVRPEQQRAVEQHGRLTFRNSGGYSVLNEVHFPGTSSFSEVIERHDAEKIDAKKLSPDSSISVAQR